MSTFHPHQLPWHHYATIIIIITIFISITISMTNHHHQLDEEEYEEESYLVPSLLTDQLTIDDAVRPYDLVGERLHEHIFGYILLKRHRLL